MKATPRSPPIIKSQSVADTISNFCLITIYLSEWGLSRVLLAQRLPLIIHRQTDIISTAE